MTSASDLRDGAREDHATAIGRRARAIAAQSWPTIAIVALAMLAIAWLGYEAYRFLARPQRIGSVAIHPGALDLVMLHDMVVDWWRGVPVYSGPRAALNNYPPESMIAFAPIYGWSSESVTVAVWLTTFVAVAVALSARLARESGAPPGAARTAAALLVVATYPVGANLGNGQVGVHILLATVAALMLVRDHAPSWQRDSAAAALLLFGLAKPTIAGPLALVALVLPGGVRVFALAAAGYVGLTCAASAAREEDLLSLLGEFLARGWSQAIRGGESNLHRLLADAGLVDWMAPASIAMVALLALFLARCRRAEPWALIGVAALVARFWSYHRWYDDLLILLMLVALARIAFDASAPRADRRRARGLGVAIAILLLAPGGLYLLPAPWNVAYRYLQIGAWIAGAAFLGTRAWRATTPARPPM